MEHPSDGGGQEPPLPAWLATGPTGITAYALARAGAEMNAAFARRLATVGLRPHTFFVLVHLAREPALTSAELARRLSMTPQSMSALLHGLADAGWVDRPGGARRGQRIDVRLTAAGRQALEAAGPVLAELGRPEAIGLTAEEGATLHALLDRVLDALAAAPEDR
ncbi:MarR family winged helix-turn-helix transcriptional regulator [Modestobacter lacusdianchii]